MCLLPYPRWKRTGNLDFSDNEEFIGVFFWVVRTDNFLVIAMCVSVIGRVIFV